MAQVLLDFAADPAFHADDSLEADGFAIGWDHAHHALVPPVEHLASGSPVRQGWQAGRAAFGGRTLAAGASVRQWLQLRLQAWQHGLAFEPVQVTPHYLRQIAASHCPVTRGRMDDPVVERVRLDAGIAAGNLAMISSRVQAARGARDWRAALATSRTLHAQERATEEGLTALEWQRLAVLGSFVAPLAHEEACALPLVVLPPNRLRLFNPVQALQALATRLMAGEGFAQRVSRLEALIPGDAARRDFRRFVQALLPRVLTAGRMSDAQALRWALEDAWTDALVMARWQRFAVQLTPAQCEQVLQRATARGVAPLRLLDTPEPLATEGWAIEQQGQSRAQGSARTLRPRAAAAFAAAAPEQAALPL